MFFSGFKKIIANKGYEGEVELLPESVPPAACTRCIKNCTRCDHRTHRGSNDEISSEFFCPHFRDQRGAKTKNHTTKQSFFSRVSHSQGQVFHGQRGQHFVRMLQEPDGLQPALSHRRRLRRRHSRQAHLALKQPEDAAQAQQQGQDPGTTKMFPYSFKN